MNENIDGNSNRVSAIAQRFGLATPCVTENYFGITKRYRRINCDGLIY